MCIYILQTGPGPCRYAKTQIYKNLLTATAYPVPVPKTFNIKNILYIFKTTTQINVFLNINRQMYKNISIYQSIVLNLIPVTPTNKLKQKQRLIRK